MPFKTYNFTFASGATGTNKQFVGAHDFIYVIPSAMTGYNADVGNATIQMRGGLSTTDEHAIIQSCTVATMTIKSVIPMPYRGTPYLSIGFGTSVTGTSSNSIDVVVYCDNADA